MDDSAGEKNKQIIRLSVKHKIYIPAITHNILYLLIIILIYLTIEWSHVLFFSIVSCCPSNGTLIIQIFLKIDPIYFSFFFFIICRKNFFSNLIYKIIFGRGIVKLKWWFRPWDKVEKNVSFINFYWILDTIILLHRLYIL